MKTSHIEGVRFSCITGQAKCVLLTAKLVDNISLGRVVQIDGGPTSYESFCIDDIGPDIYKMKIAGWWACLGADNRWDSLYIHGIQMRKLFKDLGV